MGALYTKMLRNWLDERAQIVDVRKRFSPDIRRALVIHLIDFIIQLYERQKKKQSYTNERASSAQG